jgi:hypothetical protein
VVLKEPIGLPLGTLAIDQPDKNRPDYTITFIAKDGRKIVVGHICKATAAPAETPWFWTVEFHQRAHRTLPHQGFVADFDAAEAAWKWCWESADVPIKWPPSLRR